MKRELGAAIAVSALLPLLRGSAGADNGPAGALRGEEGPYIVHVGDDPEPAVPVTSPCSGYIDPRRETTNGIDLDQGLERVTIVFSEQVRNVGAVDDELTADSFVVTETGGGLPPSVEIEVDDDLTFVDADTGRHVVALRFDGPITLQEWTTVIASVEDLDGNLIESVGDAGSGIDEPDRIDIGFLPCDVEQNGRVSPLDRVRMRQYRLEAFGGITECPACREFECGPHETARILYFDYNRNGAPSPLDWIRYTQAYLGLANSTRSWRSATMNAPQP